MFDDIIISKYSKKAEEFLKLLEKEEKEGVSCSKDGEIALQANCGGFDSHTLHTNSRSTLIGFKRPALEAGRCEFESRLLDKLDP